jgi:hypothetical protein
VADDSIDLHSRPTNTENTSIEGPLRFKLPCTLNVSSDKECQFVMVGGEIYLSLTFMDYEKYKLLKTIYKAKVS